MKYGRGLDSPSDLLLMSLIEGAVERKVEKNKKRYK
jgi:hypothetical protein